MAAVGHLLVAVAATAPLAWRADRLALGREPVATVPRFNLWTLARTADRLPHGFAGWWDAPIFAPARGTFAWSEPQPLTGLAYALGRPVLGAVGAYSALLVLTVALNGVAGAALARRLGAGPVAAFAAGVLAQTLPFAFDQLGVLQLVAVWPLLATLAAAVAWLEHPRLRHAVLVGLGLVAAVGTCGYYALLLGSVLLVAAPVVVDRTWWRDRRARLGGLAIAAALVAGLAGPVAVGQQDRLTGRRWADTTIRAGSASWHEWAPSGRFWPGYPLVALAAAGLVLGRRRPATRLLATMAALALLASLGSRLSIAGSQPWTSLVDHVDAFGRLRSPFRAAAVVQVALVGLAAAALERLGRARRTAGPAAVAVLVLVAALTSGLGPGRLVPGPTPPGAWADWLADHPDGGTVAFLPFAPGPGVAAFAPTTTRMLQAQAAYGDDHPMVNGYSGFFPADHDARRRSLEGFPDPTSVAALQRTGVRYVVVDAERWDGFDARIADRLGIAELAADTDAHLLRLPGPAA